MPPREGWPERKLLIGAMRYFAYGSNLNRAMKRRRTHVMAESSHDR